MPEAPRPRLRLRHAGRDAARGGPRRSRSWCPGSTRRRLKAALLAEGAPRARRRRRAGRDEGRARSPAGRPEALVLGCDQTLSCDGRLFSKPASPEEARDQLRALMGRTHQLHSAAVIYRGRAAGLAPRLGGAAHHGTAVGRLARRLCRAELGQRSGTRSGGYRIEEEGVRLFSRIEGDHFTILGLPLLPLLSFLSAAGEHSVMTSYSPGRRVGRPIAHSRSPRLHRHWIARHGIDGRLRGAGGRGGGPGRGAAGAAQGGVPGRERHHPAQARGAGPGGRGDGSGAADRGGQPPGRSRSGRILADNTDGEGFLGSLRQGAPGWDPADGAGHGAGRGRRGPGGDRGAPRRGRAGGDPDQPHPRHGRGAARGVRAGASGSWNGSQAGNAVEEGGDWS